MNLAQEQQHAFDMLQRAERDRDESVERLLGEVEPGGARAKRTRRKQRKTIDLRLARARRRYHQLSEQVLDKQYPERIRERQRRKTYLRGHGPSWQELQHTSLKVA